MIEHDAFIAAIVKLITDECNALRAEINRLKANNQELLQELEAGVIRGSEGLYQGSHSTIQPIAK